MTRTAGELLADTTGGLAPEPGANPLLPLIERGAARRGTLAVLALEQREVIDADLRAFRHLAERSAAREVPAGPECAAFFGLLAEGEAVARDRLGAYAAGCGVAPRPPAGRGPRAREAAYEPLAGCQAYPAYVAWLALNGSPAEVVLALCANFAAWGGYCATIAGALRRHYGFDAESCGFFDFFAEPSPELDRRALAAVQAALDAGTLDEDAEDRAHRHGRLLATYESGFWRTLWELDRQPAS
ncbi:transcriptional regulator [Streptomyces beigongshangae]|uniref:transcriptional regulator n=1 Tax=Streptomyces beigongshangae TaxID=2841597 RepID=UPI001C856211|nr:transcriptional regulator [Streptomyces sp. REN17]